MCVPAERLAGAGLPLLRCACAPLGRERRRQNERATLPKTAHEGRRCPTAYHLCRKLLPSLELPPRRPAGALRFRGLRAHDGLLTVLIVPARQVFVFVYDAAPQRGHVLVGRALGQIAIAFCFDKQEMRRLLLRSTDAAVEVTSHHLSDGIRELLPGPVDAPGTLWSLL